MGLGMLASFDGETDSAVHRLQRGLELSRRDEDHWRECIALMRLAEIELGRRNSARVLELCGALEKVAAKLGEGSETAAASAYGALAGLLDGDTSGRVERAAQVVRGVDAKAMLAYLLVSAAEIDIEAGRLADAERHAREALAAAGAVGRGSDAVLAHVVIARATRGEEARSHLDAARRELESGRPVSARARRAYEDACKETPWPASS
jgi:hypothetical protein